jgi:hypothetical protein
MRAGVGIDPTHDLATLSTGENKNPGHLRQFEDAAKAQRQEEAPRREHSRQHRQRQAGLSSQPSNRIVRGSTTSR